IDLYYLILAYFDTIIEIVLSNYDFQNKKYENI